MDIQSISESLQREFCPPLDSSLLAALLADIDPSASEEARKNQIAALRGTLIELAVHADEEGPFEDDELTGSDFCNTITTTTSSDLSTNAPFNSPLGFLQAALPHIPTDRLRRALAAEEEDALDMWELISTLLSEETEREMRERGDEDTEPPWEAGDVKRKAKKKPKPGKIALNDVRQQHQRPPPSPSIVTTSDPWTSLTSLSTHLAHLLPPHPPSFFLSYFHDPGAGTRTPYSALRAALTAIAAPDNDADDDANTTQLFHLLDVFLSPDLHHTDTLVSDITLALRVSGDENSVFEVVRVLRELDEDGAQGRFEMGVYHSRPALLASVSRRPTPARTISLPAPLPSGPAPTPPPPSSKPPPVKVHTNGWQAVPVRRAKKASTTSPSTIHLPTYTRDVNGIKTSRAADEAQPFYARRSAALQRRDELLREAARMWQRGRGDRRGRGGEVAMYFAERAREVGEGARREALERARGLVEGRRLRREADTVDLHGVTAAEAVVIVGEVLGEGGWGADKPLKIITGRGNHSAGRVSVLKPAVKKALEEEGWVVGTWDGGVILLVWDGTTWLDDGGAGRVGGGGGGDRYGAGSRQERGGRRIVRGVAGMSKAAMRVVKLKVKAMAGLSRE
ncbi:Smr domain-containing protein [Favolaschia claudopus]|uniref:Smr domain-containing protein n=1 Tax=Favolaschia claudopus TaxID=2862362 RepID=A0AAW0BX88_9AGAR